MTDVAYKIIAADEWRLAAAEGLYAGSAVDLQDGYIHMSTEAQLAETARRHYAGRDDLILLTVDLSGMGDDLVWERSRGGALFPHLYAPLRVSSVTGDRRLSVSSDGEMLLEETT